MINGIDASLSGLLAAETRQGVAANNIVNQRSGARQPTASAPDYTGYTPQSVSQSSLATGGTRAVINPIDPAYVPVADVSADGEPQVMPNVDETASLLETSRAGQAYKASLATLKTQDEMLQEAVDITG